MFNESKVEVFTDIVKAATDYGKSETPVDMDYVYLIALVEDIKRDLAKMRKEVAVAYTTPQYAYNPNPFQTHAPVYVYTAAGYQAEAQTSIANAKAAQNHNPQTVSGSMHVHKQMEFPQELYNKHYEKTCLFGLDIQAQNADRDL